MHAPGRRSLSYCSISSAVFPFAAAYRTYLRFHFNIGHRSILSCYPQLFPQSHPVGVPPQRPSALAIAERATSSIPLE